MAVVYIYDEKGNEILVSVDKIVTVVNLKSKDKVLITLSDRNYIMSNEDYIGIIEKIKEAENL